METTSTHWFVLMLVSQFVISSANITTFAKQVVKAASGALAMLTASSNKICNKVSLDYIIRI